MGAEKQVWRLFHYAAATLPERRVAARSPKARCQNVYVILIRNQATVSVWRLAGVVALDAARRLASRPGFAFPSRGAGGDAGYLSGSSKAWRMRPNNGWCKLMVYPVLLT